jgi:hypothetical protein
MNATNQGGVGSILAGRAKQSRGCRNAAFLFFDPFHAGSTVRTKTRKLGATHATLERTVSNPPLTIYFLNCEDAFSKAFFIEAHAVSTPACMCCHADSLAVRISCNFLFAASRLARIALICSSYLARASALISWLLALNLSTSASHFLICDSIIVKYSSFLLFSSFVLFALMLRLLC